MRRVPQAGPGGAQTVRVSAGGTARREANRVGARTGVRGGMSEIADDGGAHRAGGAILRVENLGVEGSDGARGGCIPRAGTRAAGGGGEWQVIRERWETCWRARRQGRQD